MKGPAEEALDPPDWPAWFDGEFQRAGDVTLPARSPWALYGESVFETLAVVDAAIEFEAEHAARLGLAAARVLGCEGQAQIRQAFDAVRAIALKRAGEPLAVRVTLANAGGGRLHRLVQARPLRRMGANPDGIELWVPPGELAELARGGPGGCKHGARLGLRMARRAALAAGAFDAAMLGSDGLPACGTVGNLVLLCGGRLLTPPLSSGALPGIARGALLAAGELDLRERAPELADWRAIQGLWLVGSVLGVAPVVRLGWPAREPDLGEFAPEESLGPRFRDLREALERAVGRSGPLAR